jgi:hypothetical protein
MTESKRHLPKTFAGHSFGKWLTLVGSVSKLGKYFCADFVFDASPINEAIHPCIKVALKLVVQAAVHPDSGPDK